MQLGSSQGAILGLSICGGFLPLPGLLGNGPTCSPVPLHGRIGANANSGPAGFGHIRVGGNRVELEASSSISESG